MNNELTNTAADIAAQVTEGKLELVEVKGVGMKGKLITGGIALGAVAGAGVGGWFLGRRHERKTFEERLEAIEEYLAGAKEYECDDDIDDEDLLIDDLDDESDEAEPKTEGKK